MTLPTLVGRGSVFVGGPSKAAEKSLILRKRTSAAKASFSCSTYGTAEAVPLTKQGFSAASKALGVFGDCCLGR